MIQEVYDNEFAHHTFAAELERALEANCSIIVIEPTQLGEETARWIYVGNCLHKTAIVTGVASLFGGKNECDVLGAKLNFKVLFQV